MGKKRSKPEKEVQVVKLGICLRCNYSDSLANFCSQCGAVMAAYPYCGNCGKPISPLYEYCPWCGSSKAWLEILAKKGPS